MKGDIDKSHIMMGVMKVHPITFLCPGVANKDTFESVRGELR